MFEFCQTAPQNAQNIIFNSFQLIQVVHYIKVS